MIFLNRTSFITLMHREILRFLKVINQTLLSPLMTNFLYLIIFGVTIGTQIQKIGSVSYIQFMIPGLIIMDVIISAYSNTSSSLFLNRYLHYMDNLLIAPISNIELVLAYIIGGVFRGVLIGCLIWCMTLFFAPMGLCHPFVFVLLLIAISAVFSGFGLMIALWADDFENLSMFTSYFITPLTFIGGVFYSVSMLPPLLKTITFCNPFFYIIDIFRWSMIGLTEGSLLLSTLLIIALLAFFLLVPIALFRAGYKLKA